MSTAGICLQSRHADQLRDSACVMQPLVHPTLSHRTLHMVVVVIMVGVQVRVGGHIT